LNTGNLIFSRFFGASVFELQAFMAAAGQDNASLLFL